MLETYIQRWKIESFPIIQCVCFFFYSKFQHSNMLWKPRMEVHINKASWPLGLISSPGVVFLDVSRNHWWLGWVMIHHATIMPPPLVELKTPVRKFWWNKFKQHSREVWCNWPGKHPWKEFLGKKCQLLRWVGKIEPHHIAWDLRFMT